MKEGEGGISKVVFLDKTAFKFAHFSDEMIGVELIEAIKREDYEYAYELSTELKRRSGDPAK
jgi:hypothetical protein